MALTADTPRPEATLGVAELIRSARNRRGLSARALSSAAGLSPSYVGKIEARESVCSLPVFGRLAMALNLNPLEVWLVVSVAATQ